MQRWLIGVGAGVGDVEQVGVEECDSTRGRTLTMTMLPGFEAFVTISMIWLMSVITKVCVTVSAIAGVARPATEAEDPGSGPKVGPD